MVYRSLPSQLYWNERLDPEFQRQQQDTRDVRKALKATRVVQILQESPQLLLRQGARWRLLLAAGTVQEHHGGVFDNGPMNSELDSNLGAPTNTYERSQKSGGPLSGPVAGNHPVGE